MPLEEGTLAERPVMFTYRGARSSEPPSGRRRLCAGSSPCASPACCSARSTFLTDAEGNGFAILAQAPAGKFRDHAPFFERLLASLLPRAGAAELLAELASLPQVVRARAEPGGLVVGIQQRAPVDRQAAAANARRQAAAQSP